MTLGAADHGAAADPTAPPAPIEVVLDRSAGHGNDVAERLREVGYDARSRSARDPEDVEMIVADTVRQVTPFLVVVGDDATVSAAVNGLMTGRDGGGQTPVLGVLNGGVYCDFTRTFGLPDDPGKAARRLATGLVQTVDVGRATATGPDGEQATRHFANLAQAGLGGAVATGAARRRGRTTRRRYFLSYWRAIARHRRASMQISGDRRTFDALATNVVVGNCPYDGHGVMLSPRSWPGDGYLDLSVFTGPRSDSFTLLPKMFQGEHVPHPNIIERRAKRIRIEATPAVAVEADGRPVGSTPATFEVVEGALRLKV